MDTKQKILLTSFNLFMFNGYDNTSMADIAKEIGITKPALYYHFENKDELFVNVVELFLIEMENMMMQILSPTSSLKDNLYRLFSNLKKMTEYMEKFIQVKVENPVLKMYFFIYESMMRYPEARNKMKKLYKSMEDISTRLIEDEQKNGTVRNDINARIIAFELNALVEGIFLMYIFDPSIDIENIGEKIFENYWIRLKK